MSNIIDFKSRGSIVIGKRMAESINEQLNNKINISSRTMENATRTLNDTQTAIEKLRKMSLFERVFKWPY